MIAWFREWGLLAFVVVAMLLWVAFVFTAAPEIGTDWFSRPLRDATVGDAFILLVIYLIMRK